MTELYIGDVWIDHRQSRHRRIIAASGGKLMYSFGGHVNRWCRWRTFLTWVRNRKAELQFRVGETRVEPPKRRV